MCSCQTAAIEREEAGNLPLRTSLKDACRTLSCSTIEFRRHASLRALEVCAGVDRIACQDTGRQQLLNTTRLNADLELPPAQSASAQPSCGGAVSRWADCAGVRRGHAGNQAIRAAAASAAIEAGIPCFRFRERSAALKRAGGLRLVRQAISLCGSAGEGGQAARGLRTGGRLKGRLHADFLRAPHGSGYGCGS